MILSKIFKIQISFFLLATISQGALDKKAIPSSSSSSSSSSFSPPSATASSSSSASASYLLCVSHDKKISITANPDLTVAIHDAHHNNTQKLQGFTKPISAAAIRDDNKFLLTGSSDGLITLWHYDKCVALSKITAHSTHISKLQFTGTDSFFSTAAGETEHWRITSAGIQPISPQNSSVYTTPAMGDIEDACFGIVLTNLGELTDVTYETSVMADLAKELIASPLQITSKQYQEPDDDVLYVKHTVNQKLATAHNYMTENLNFLDAQRWTCLNQAKKEQELVNALDSIEKLFIVGKNKKYAWENVHRVIVFFRSQKLDLATKKAFLAKLKELHQRIKAQ